MLPENIIYITVLISIVGYFFYIRDIFYGETRPNLVSWFFWMLAPFFGVFFQLKAGVGLSVLPIFMAGFGPLIIILVSIFSKNSVWKITSFDIVCGVLSLMALMFYVFTHNLGISILFAILTDAFAGIPTLIKAWKFPETETAAVYLPGIINNILGLLIIKNWIFSIYSFSVYFILINALTVVFLYHKKLAIKLY